MTAETVWKLGVHQDHDEKIDSYLVPHPQTGSTEGAVSDLFYSDISYEESDLSLHIQKLSIPQSLVLF